MHLHLHLDLPLFFVFNLVLSTQTPGSAVRFYVSPVKACWRFEGTACRGKREDGLPLVRPTRKRLLQIPDG